MSRLALLLAWIASAALLDVAAALHATLVVSVCRERAIDGLVASLLDKLASNLYKHSAEVQYYCKCTENRTVTGRLCTNLPNVGREALAYLTHMVESYDQLEGADGHVFLFLNGGSGSKPHATQDFVNLGRFLAARKTAHAFIDGGGFKRTEEDRARTQRIPGSNADFRRDAVALCFAGGDTESPISGDAVAAQPDGARCPCRSGSPRHCEAFQPSVCPDGQKLSFQHQLNCTWIGHSQENVAEISALKDQVAFEAAIRLPPAERTTSLVDWLWDRWGINGYTWEAVLFHPCGNFGVSAAVLRERPRTAYRAALRELERSGQNAGMVGMYFERAWRVMFSLPPQSAGGGGA